jgi:uncharacterized protein with ParB-like and HNH nuclease domain
MNRIKKITLDPRNQNFSEVMSNGKQYIVPHFQRDYSWEEDQWDILWQDIEVVRTSRIQHFMGYLLLQTDDDREFQIIDGQQRLTTLSLLILAALSRIDALIRENGTDREADQQRMDMWRNAYVGVLDTVTMRTDAKLKLNRHNNKHFQDLSIHLDVVQQRNVLRTNRCINKCFEYFRQKFADDNGQEIARRIKDIEDGLLFTSIIVSDDINAYVVFETLNARGIHLSPSDLLKNYLLSRLALDDRFSGENFDDFEERWSSILEQLGEREFTNFLRSQYGISHSPLPSKTDLYRSLKDKVNHANHIFEYLFELEKSAPLYAALQNHHDEFWKDIPDAREPLELLKTFNVETPLSLLMAAYQQYDQLEFIRLLRKIVNFSMRYNIIGNRLPNAQEARYNKMANEITQGKHIGEVIRMIGDLYPPDETFKSDFVVKTMPGRQSTKKIMLLLRLLERHISQGELPPGELTLEHVLPFSPDDEWQEYFGRDDYLQAIDRLGNFAILSATGNMAQESFNEKKSKLAESTYKINQHIAGFSRWDMDNLKEHQAWLARQAASLWKISELSKK